MDILYELLGKLQISCTQDQADNITENIRILHERGLSEISKRLLDQTNQKQFLDALIELGLTADIIKNIPDKIPLLIEYEPFEPKEHKERPDLKIKFDDITYYIQIKMASSLEKDNRRYRLIKTIQDKAKQIPVGKFFDMSLSDDFNDANVDDFIKFINDKAILSVVNVKHGYVGNNELAKATVMFSNPEGKELDRLTMKCYDSHEYVNETGLAENQLKASMRKAAQAFEWSSNEKKINIIAIELSQGSADIDITVALYGNEEYKFSSEVIDKGVVHDGIYRKTRSRSEGGIFNNSLYADKIAGVIAIKRKSINPLEMAYWKVLCINERFISLQNKIESLIAVDKTVRFDEAPGCDRGFFDLEK